MDSGSQERLRMDTVEGKGRVFRLTVAWALALGLLCLALGLLTGGPSRAALAAPAPAPKPPSSTDAYTVYLPLVIRNFPPIPNDPDFGLQWGLETVGACGAWGATCGCSEVVVAVLDTGIDLDHPDLAAKLWTNPGEVCGNGLDDDGNKYVDDCWGWDFGGDGCDLQRRQRPTGSPLPWIPRLRHRRGGDEQRPGRGRAGLGDDDHAGESVR